MAFIIVLVVVGIIVVVVVVEVETPVLVAPEDGGLAVAAEGILECLFDAHYTTSPAMAWMTWGRWFLDIFEGGKRGLGLRWFTILEAEVFIFVVMFTIGDKWLHYPL